MAYSPSDMTRCKARVDALVDALLTELDCDADRFEALCGEFSGAIQDMQEQLTGLAQAHHERHTRLWPAERVAEFEQDNERYSTLMTGLMFVLGERRGRLGVGSPA